MRTADTAKDPTALHKLFEDLQAINKKNISQCNVNFSLALSRTGKSLKMVGPGIPWKSAVNSSNKGFLKNI